MNDIVFKAIMYPKIIIMKKLLECILEKEIENIRYLGQELSIFQFIEKGKRLDLFARNENELFDVEVTNNFNKYISWRNYAYAAHIYAKSIKKGENYNNYKHTYLINIIGNKKGKIPIRKERHVDQINEDMTNVITEIQVNVDYFIKEYYNKGNKKLINEYKYIIMLGLNLEELKEFYKEYGDDIMKEYMDQMENVLDYEEIEPLFTKEEERVLEVNAAREEGVEKGEKKKEAELAKKFKQQGVDLNIISKATGLSVKKIMML